MWSSHTLQIGKKQFWQLKIMTSLAKMQSARKVLHLVGTISKKSLNFLFGKLKGRRDPKARDTRDYDAKNAAKFN